MFENPIKGSVGGACKKLAGIVYGCTLILMFVYTALSIAAIIWGDDVMRAISILYGSSATTTSIVIRLAAIGVVDAIMWVCGYVSALIWNVIGEIVNSLAIIAHRMPKGTSKE
jgi:hypothetical protein